MPTGERLSKRRRQEGFTYLWILFAVVLVGLGGAAAAQRWSTALHRDREYELIFRGNEYARAIASYRNAGSSGPQSLEELLIDGRTGKPVHHLRRLYVDPFTGQADWILLRGVDGTLAGVRSRSEERAMVSVGLPQRPGGGPQCVCNRMFYASAPKRPADGASAADAASAPVESSGRSPYGT